MKKSLVAVMLGAISLTLVGCGAPKQINDSVTIEAGDELVLEASDFFDNENGIEFDDSAVDTSKVGEYEIIATYKKESYTITVKVEDTTAPKFELAKDSIVTNDLESLEAESFVESIEDVSDTTVELKFETEPEEDGEYEASIVVTDAYGNSSEKSITVVLDTIAPTISGVKNKTVKQSDVTAEPTIDFSKYSAEDSRDGVVECETSMEKTGDKEYTVTVTATDEAGNVATETAVIKVEASTANSSKSASSKSESTGSNNKPASGSSTASSGGSAPAASQPADPSSTVAESSDAGDNVTHEQVTPEQVAADAADNQIMPEHWYCGWCNDGVDYGSAEAFDAHARDVHGVY